MEADPEIPATQPPRQKTPLESLLDPDKTAAFGQYLDGRVQSCASSMNQFFDKRQIYAAQMEDDFSWRGKASDRSRNYGDEEDSANDIFQLQNDSLNIIGGFAEFIKARTSDDIFGTDPYYAINPEGMEDAELADDIQKHSEWKLRGSPFKPAALDAIDNAIGLGEGVMKIHWHTEIDTYETVKTVLHIQGIPVVTPDGQHLEESDLEPLQAQGGDTEELGEPVLLPEPDEIGESSPMLTSIKMEPGWSVQIEQVEFKELAVEQSNVTYNGVKVATMFYKDFLCPLTVPCIKDSDFVGHRFQMRLSEAAKSYNLPKETVDRLQNESDNPKEEGMMPKPDENQESVTNLNKPDPLVEFVECWVKYDPVGDGKNRRIYALLCVPLQEVIEMDYMANRTPGGRLPFFVIRSTPVKNRWYGRGYYEMYAKAQEFIDRQLNRVELRNRHHSNPLVGCDKSMFGEDEETSEIKLRPGATIQLKNGGKLQEAIQFLDMPDLDDRTWQLMQFYIQVVQVRSGVTSAAQGEVSSLPSTATATGIESILQSASVLARLPINCVRADLEQALLYCVTLIYANFDADEVFTYFEGDQQKAKTLAAVDVKNLDMNVRLLLTRFKERESLESATKAVEIFDRWKALPPQAQEDGKPLYTQAIKALGFAQSDAIIKVTPLPQPGELDPMTGQPMQQQAINGLAQQAIPT